MPAGGGGAQPLTTGKQRIKAMHSDSKRYEGQFAHATLNCSEGFSRTCWSHKIYSMTLRVPCHSLSVWHRACKWLSIRHLKRCSHLRPVGPLMNVAGQLPCP